MPKTLCKTSLQDVNRGLCHFSGLHLFSFEIRGEIAREHAHLPIAKNYSRETTPCQIIFVHVCNGERPTQQEAEENESGKESRDLASERA